MYWNLCDILGYFVGSKHYFWQGVSFNNAVDKVCFSWTLHDCTATSYSITFLIVIIQFHHSYISKYEIYSLVCRSTKRSRSHYEECKRENENWNYQKIQKMLLNLAKTVNFLCSFQEGSRKYLWNAKIQTSPHGFKTHTKEC